MQSYDYILDGQEHSVEYTKSNIPKNFKITNEQNEMFSTIKYLFTKWKEINPHIKWWMIAGSLLGTLRHKGIIPWDNDGDIGIMFSEYHKVKCGVFGDITIEANTCGYKVKKTNTKFPFIDVFIFDTDYKDSSKITICSPIYNNNKTYYYSFVWNEQFHATELETLETAKFEGIDVYIPKNATNYLQILYGNDCLTNLYYDAHVENHALYGIEQFESFMILGKDIRLLCGFDKEPDFIHHESALCVRIVAELFVRSKIDPRKIIEIIVTHNFNKAMNIVRNL
jgi:phosphorylcholine metabolism protein LicD